VSVEARPRTVFDCMVYLQAAVSDRGTSFAVLQRVQAGELELLVSEPILAEVRDVLTRPKTVRRFPRLTAARVAAFLERVDQHATLVQAVPAAFVHARDPKDEPYVNLALAGGARYVVTWDRDLLDLMNESRDDGRAFRQSFPELRILTPDELLRETAPPAGSTP
jgi:putative PIN family toxin of toxin-antitoxin system